MAHKQNTTLPWISLVVLSIGTGLTGFAPSLLALQIFDRVIPSGHGPTLLVLLLGAVGSLVLSMILDLQRRRLLETSLTRRTLDETIDGRFTKAPETPVIEPLLSPFDVPLALVAIMILGLIALPLGISALVMGILLALLGAWSMARERSVTADRKRLQDHMERRCIAAETHPMDAHQAEGLAAEEARLWAEILDGKRSRGVANGLSLFVRGLIPVIGLSLGALLVLNGRMSPGGMIAGSLLLARAVAPFGMLSAGLKGWIALTRQSQAEPVPIEVRPRRAGLMVEDLVLRDRRGLPVLAIPHLKIAPGEVVAVAGPPGSGKSHFARSLATEGGTGNAGIAGIDGAPIRVGLLERDPKLPPIPLTAATPDQVLLEGLVEHFGLGRILTSIKDAWSVPMDELGRDLSSTQLILLSLAVLLSRRLEVLACDGPLDELDPETTFKVDEALMAAREQGLSILLITQRRSILNAASAAYTIHGGRLRPVNDQPLSIVPPNHREQLGAAS